MENNGIVVRYLKVNTTDGLLVFFEVVKWPKDFPKNNKYWPIKNIIDNTLMLKYRLTDADYRVVLGRNSDVMLIAYTINAVTAIFESFVDPEHMSDKQIILDKLPNEIKVQVSGIYKNPGNPLGDQIRMHYDCTAIDNKGRHMVRFMIDESCLKDMLDVLKPNTIDVVEVQLMDNGFIKHKDWDFKLVNDMYYVVAYNNAITDYIFDTYCIISPIGKLNTLYAIRCKDAISKRKPNMMYQREDGVWKDFIESKILDQAEVESIPEDKRYEACMNKLTTDDAEYNDKIKKFKDATAKFKGELKLHKHMIHSLFSVVMGEIDRTYTQFKRDQYNDPAKDSEYVAEGLNRMISIEHDVKNMMLKLIDSAEHLMGAEMRGIKDPHSYEDMKEAQKGSRYENLGSEFKKIEPDTAMPYYTDDSTRPVKVVPHDYD